MAEVKSIYNLMAESNFYLIPIFQRRYEWTTKECQKLLDDISNVNTVKPNGSCKRKHFLGTFICKAEDVGGIEKFILLDGQQRSVSCYLMLLAMYMRVKYKLPKLAENISSLLYEYNHSLNKRFDKIESLSDDKIMLQALIDLTNWDVVVEDKEEGSKITQEDLYITHVETELITLQSNSAIYTNFMFYYNEFEDTSSLGNLFEKLKKVTVNFFILDNSYDAYEVFESINTTGMKLTVSDMLKNHLFMRLNVTQQMRYYTDYWKPILDKMSKNSFEDFLQMYAMYVTESDNIQKAKTYEALQNYYDSHAKVSTKTAFTEIKYYADIYMSYHHTKTLNKYDDVERYGDYFSNYLNWGPGVLFYFYMLDMLETKVLTEQEVMKYLNLFMNHSIRSIFIKGNNVIHAQYIIALIKELRHSKVAHYEDVIIKHIWKLSSNYYYPSDEALLNDRTLVINDKKAQLLLYLLDDGKNITDISNTVLEHILPRNPGGDWCKVTEEKNISRYKNRLGNLVLTVQGTGCKSTNAPFDTKKGYYENSDFKATADVAIYKDWGLEDIDDRSKDLLNRVKQVFPELRYVKGPDKVLDLSSIKSQVNKTVKCGKREYKIINTRRELVMEVMDYLLTRKRYKTLSKLDCFKGVLVSPDKAGAKHERLVDHNYYVSKRFLDSKASLITLKTVLEENGLTDEIKVVVY